MRGMPDGMDFSAALERARDAQQTRYKAPSNKLLWPLRNAKGEGRRQAQSKAKSAQDWMAKKMDKALDEKFWEVKKGA